jgi:YidC/Oxa1 family membrane protein insertase
MFHTIFYVPLYNALIFLTHTFGGSLGLAVVGLTLIVKLILSPLSHKSIISQIEQKKLQPLVEDLKKKYPDQKEQSTKLMELYKEHKTNPFAGCLLILLQLPVIIALYRVFLSGAVINPVDLYSFVHAPVAVNGMFLGLNMAAKGSVILAILAGLSQFLQMHLSPAMQNTSGPVADNADTQTKMAASMTSSMKYTMPFMIAFFGYAVPGAVALYWIISNVFMIAQERIVMARMK